MKIVRLLLAALMALAVMVMGFFVAAFVVLAGLFAAMVQFFRRGSRPPGAAPGGPATRTYPSPAGGDVIDVETTKVESKRELI